MKVSQGSPSFLSRGRLSGPASRRGTIMIFALIIIAVGAIAISGWVYLMGGLSEYTDAMRDGMRRRVTLENSRAMANQYYRGYLISGAAQAAWTNYAFASGGNTLGGIGVGAAGANPLTTANSGDILVNLFGPAGASYSDATYFAGFSTNLTANLSDGTTNGTIPWRIQVRSRAPMFGYDVLNPIGMSNFPSSVSVANPSALGTSEGPRTSADFLNSAFPPEIPTTVTHVAYSGTVTLGGSSIPVTSFSSTQANGSHSSNNNRQSRLWTGTTGNIAVIYLNRDPSPNSPSARIYRITGNDARQLVLSSDSGTSTVSIADPSSAPPILIQVTSAHGSSGGSGTNNFFITVPQGNQRRVFLSVDSRHRFTTTISGGGSGTTRLVANFGGTVYGGTSRPGFALPGNHVLQGGFRAGASDVSVSGGTLSIIRETASLPVLEAMAPRRGWVETYRND